MRTRVLDSWAETAPRVIESEVQYEEIANRAGELVGKGRKRTPEETQFISAAQARRLGKLFNVDAGLFL